MVSRKYTDDYRTEHVRDANGKVVHKAVYIGPYFVHTEAPAAVALSKKLCLPVCIALWVLFVVCFLQNGVAARQWWVSVFYLFSAVALIPTTWSAISLLLAKEPMDRETSDDLSRRYKKMTLGFTVLTAAAVAAGVVACLVYGAFEMPGDLLFLGGNAVSSLLGLLLFSRKKSFETREISRHSEEFAGLLEAKTAKK